MAFELDPRAVDNGVSVGVEAEGAVDVADGAMPVEAVELGEAEDVATETSPEDALEAAEVACSALDETLGFEEEPVTEALVAS